MGMSHDLLDRLLSDYSDRGFVSEAKRVLADMPMHGHTSHLLLLGTRLRRD
jgi:hypothetical protein